MFALCLKIYLAHDLPENKKYRKHLPTHKYALKIHEAFFCPFHPKEIQHDVKIYQSY